jgi:AAA+ superfamily predicted ATPase
MNAPENPRLDWSTANQRLLAAEFARLKARLRGEDEPAVRAQYEQASAGLESPAAIDQIAERFGLSGFERDVLLLTAGVEMDSELAGLCAQASATGQRPWATFGLTLAVLPDPHWSALAPTGPLRQWRLVETADETSPVTGRLRVDERVLHYLAGINYLEPRLRPLLRLIDEPDVMAAGQQSLAETIVAAAESAPPPLPVLQLPGADDDGKCDVAAYAAARLGLRLYAIAGDDLPASAHELEALSGLWQREAALLDAALLIESGDAVPSPSLKRFAEQVGGVTFIAARSAITLARHDWRFQVDKPGLDEQQELWRKSLGRDADVYGESLDAVASEFRLSARDIRRAGAELARPSGPPDCSDGPLWQTCRGLQGRRLDSLAQHIEPSAGWDDLILPEPQKLTLRQIAAHLRHRATVYQRWGFAGKGTRGLGLSALFAGESGTGKTMAAEVLANELHLDLYRIDLSAVVSKYIGETEKNLARVFDAAEDSGIILLFDEADALFGKRSEVRDSHDRYANIEVSYLLQRMEAYRGLAILTSNQKAALDTAFHRRLRFVIHFPFPEAGEREAIWRSIFPVATPTEGLDYGKLARLQMAGGNIRNIALNAAFLAAEENQPVAMTHILRAAQAEAGKRERPLSDAETRGWL